MQNIVGGLTTGTPAADVGFDASAEPCRAASTLAPLLSDLMILVARGDRQAFEKIYDALFARCHACAAQLLEQSQAHVIETVLEESFLLLWQEAGQFSPLRDSVTGWMHERVRRAAAASGSACLATPDLLQTLSPNSQVATVLQTLDEGERQMIAMAFLQGISFEEIADRMALPANEVRTRLQTATSRLRKALASH
jgi:RNA polymerase sigma-70 factor, ECF subfamily